MIFEKMCSTRLSKVLASWTAALMFVSQSHFANRPWAVGQMAAS